MCAILLWILQDLISLITVTLIFLSSLNFFPSIDLGFAVLSPTLPQLTVADYVFFKLLNLFEVQHVIFHKHWMSYSLWT